MQTPPPVPELLDQSAALAVNLQQLLGDPNADVDWTWHEDEDSWSLTEIACHLRDVEREVHQRRFKALIAEDGVFLAGVSADEWAEERGYALQDGPTALEEFRAARHETLQMLRNLPAELWERHGRHAFLGNTTMHELIHLMTRHDDIHWEQVREVLAAEAKARES